MNWASQAKCREFFLLGIGFQLNKTFVHVCEFNANEWVFLDDECVKWCCEFDGF